MYASISGIPEEKIDVELENSTLTVSRLRERSEMEDGRLFRYERPFGRVRALGRSARGD